MLVFTRVFKYTMENIFALIFYQCISTKNVAKLEHSYLSYYLWHALAYLMGVRKNF